MQPKVSVIIPVYKAEKYIEKCVRTLFGQTLDSLEYIFVDDCSPDKSIDVMRNVLEEYPSRQSQVKVIRHEHNTGVSQSRQDGVDAATGEYLIHCDPDDWVELEMYEKMYQKAKETNADIIGCDYWEEYGNTSIQKEQNFILDRKDIFIAILEGRLHPSLWSRLIKRQFILDKKVKFDPTIALSEDANYIVPLHMSTDNIHWIDKEFYHYRLSSASITHNIGEKQVFSHIKVIKEMSKFCSNNKKIIEAYNGAKARAMQALITQSNIYDPSRWLLETKGLPYSSFGSVKHKISPWLIRHRMFKINLLLISLFRFLKR